MTGRTVADLPSPNDQTNLLDSLVDRTLRSVNDADAAAAAQRVAEIRTQRLSLIHI